MRGGPNDERRQISAPTPSMTIAVLAQLIRHHRLEAEPYLITNLLNQDGSDITLGAVEHIFEYYQINKTADRPTLY